MSRAWLATSFFNRAFSASSSLSRFASLAFMPPYCASQRCHGALSPLTTIDGQHRILGVDMEIKSLTEQINKREREKQRARADSRITDLTEEIARLSERLERLQNEAVGLEICVEPDSDKARQMFVDVADNAKGISRALTARFDSSKIANRTLDRVMNHALLKNKVDLEQDRMTLKNPNLLGAKHVADLTRAVAVGVSGRIGRKRENELGDATIIEQVHSYLGCITEAFTDLSAVAEGNLTPQQLRQDSLLGNIGILRVLAGVWHELHAKEVDDDEITEFFRKLDKHMAAPVDDESIWRVTRAADDFEPNASAPIMRTQNLQHLAGVITEWFTNPPAKL